MCIEQGRHFHRILTFHHTFTLRGPSSSSYTAVLFSQALHLRSIGFSYPLTQSLHSSLALLLDPVGHPVYVAGHLGVQPRVDPAALAGAHDPQDVVAAVVEAADQGAATVLLKRFQEKHSFS